MNNDYERKYKKYKKKYLNLKQKGGGKNKILLTAPPNTGKSTALKKIVDELKLKYDLVGFYTLEILNANKERIGFEVVSVNNPDERRVIASLGTHPTGIKLGTKWTVFPNKLNELLEKIKPGPNSIIIIDEIAPMQTISDNFREFVENSLNSDNIVIGTIKFDNVNDFITMVKSKDNVEIIVLNESNRDDIPNEVIVKIEQLQSSKI